MIVFGNKQIPRTLSLWNSAKDFSRHIFYKLSIDPYKFGVMRLQSKTATAAAAARVSAATTLGVVVATVAIGHYCKQRADAWRSCL